MKPRTASPTATMTIFPNMISKPMLWGYSRRNDPAKDRQALAKVWIWAFRGRQHGFGTGFRT